MTIKELKNSVIVELFYKEGGITIEYKENLIIYTTWIKTSKGVKSSKKVRRIIRQFSVPWDK